MQLTIQRARTGFATYHLVARNGMVVDTLRATYNRFNDRYGVTSERYTGEWYGPPEAQVSRLGHAGSIQAALNVALPLIESWSDR